MSLDTVLKIGKALRSSRNSLHHFKYVEPCPTDKDGNYPFCISIPVLDNFEINWNGIKKVPENKRNDLYLLRFKTSNSDSLMKYIYGDIYYLKKSTIKKNGEIETKEGGAYRLENPKSKGAFKLSSFDRGEEDFQSIVKIGNKENLMLFQFRNSLNKDLSIIETILDNIPAVQYFVENNHGDTLFLDFLNDSFKIQEAHMNQVLQTTSKPNLKKIGVNLSNEVISENDREKLLQIETGEIFVHFEFPNDKSWYDYKNDLNLATKKMLQDFVDNTENGLVLKKTLYKTLCSGDKKNDIQFPDFKQEARYKSKGFEDETMLDLFYGIDYANKGLFIPNTDIKIIVLPNGDNLSAEDYLSFQEKSDEKAINQKNQPDDSEFLLNIFNISKENNITRFDVIFTKKSKGAGTPDVDLIEISGIEKSTLRRIKERISEINRNVQRNRRSYFTNTVKEFYPFYLSTSFRNILGNPQSDNNGKVSFKANPKYQTHILKVLPLIYKENYHNDEGLLPAFIQNAEYSIRFGDPKFNFLKFDFEFLISIQNNKNNKFMEIIESQSYQVGNLLGSLAKNFAGQNSPIKSFEKNYVGNLTRRISSLSDFIKLKNDIEQKLIMHEKTKYENVRITSYDLAQKIKEFEGNYNKEEAAFGFFESYFKPLPKKQKEENNENQ